MINNLRDYEVRYEFGGIKQKSDSSVFTNKVDFYPRGMRTQKIPLQ